MLSNEKKRAIFLKSRTENYQASLRLEGLSPRPVPAEKNQTLGAEATIKIKNVQ